MNRYHTLIILLLAPFALAGQAVKSGAFSTNYGKVDYVQYQASGSPAMFVLYEFAIESDSNLSGRFKSLIPVANKFNASIVGMRVPGDPSTYKNDHVKSIHIPDSAVDRKIAVLNNPTSTDVHYFTKNGFDVVLIDPRLDSLESVGSEIEPIALVRGSDQSELVQNSFETLKATGFWLPKGIRTPYSEKLIESLISDIGWIDSVAKIVRDSAKLALYTASVGIQTEVPGVIRQGQKLELNVKSARKGSVRVRFLDLSSKVIFEKSVELGKGFQLIELETSELEWGVYYLEIKGQEISERHKFMIRG